MGTSDRTNEHPDTHVYQAVIFPRDSAVFFLESLKFYEALLQSDLDAVINDPYLQRVLTERDRESLSVEQELEKIRRLIAWISPEDEAQRSGFCDWPVQVPHGVIRYLKSVGYLYLSKLQVQRDSIASRPNVSKFTVEDVDRKLAVLRENLERGVFHEASIIPLLTQDFSPDESPTEPFPEELSTRIRKPRPEIIDSIEILDSQLRERCLDLFVQFKDDGQLERLDTVVSEATRILEDRLCRQSGAPSRMGGADLAAFAFNKKDPKIRVSVVPAEQEAAHLLFRGVFGFIRNQVHHRLVGEMIPQRVLQVVGTIDYLLSIVGASTRADDSHLAGQEWSLDES